MNSKKALAMAGMILLMSGGFIMAVGQTGNSPATQNLQNRVLFVDQDGDGICDYFTDHDNDGIPNCQDPDWSRAQNKNGTGNQYRKGQGGNSGQFGNRHGFQKGNSFSNQSFRQHKNQFGGGVCDGTGPKGQAKRNGKR